MGLDTGNGRDAVEGTAAAPILIVGALRSGTTMFRLMLGHHSRVGYAQESEFGFDDLGDEGFPPVEQLHARLATHRQFLNRGFTLDPSLSYRDAVRDFMRQAHAQGGKERVAAVIHSAFHRTPDFWPDARYVHVLRDPRDVANSCVTIGWAGNPYFGVDTWIRAERRWDALRARVPAERLYEVRYEELVTDPEGTLGGVCRFLGVDYEPAMLRYHDDTTYSAPDPRLIYQWRRKMPERVAARVEAKCGALLSARGYEPSSADPVVVSRSEEALLWLDHRAGRARHGIRKYGPALWTMQRLVRVLPSESLRREVQLRRNAVDLQHLK